MKKHRLMIITHDLAIGGLQQVVVNICRNIDREKFEVSVLCLRELGEFTPEVEQLGIKVIFLPKKKKGTDYFPYLRMAKILRTEKIDIIHTHNSQPFLDGTIASFFTGVKTIVHTDHARDFPDLKRIMFLEWLFSHFAYKMVGVSQHTSKNLIKYEKISPQKITTIINGSDESKYSIKIDIKKKKKELGISDDALVIGLGVRFTKQKGITYLIKAMPEVVKKIPNIQLVIAGDGGLKESLIKEAEELGVLQNVKFIGPRVDMPEILKIFDLYVLPSLWEGLPMVIIEAMAARCPVLATDVGGNYMAIEHGKNGSLIPSQSVTALSSEIISLLNNDTLRKQYVEKSYEKFLNNFSAGVMTEKYERLYLRLDQ